MKSPLGCVIRLPPSEHTLWNQCLLSLHETMIINLNTTMPLNLRSSSSKDSMREFYRKPNKKKSLNSLKKTHSDNRSWSTTRMKHLESSANGSKSSLGFNLSMPSNLTQLLHWLRISLLMVLVWMWLPLEKSAPLLR